MKEERRKDREKEGERGRESYDKSSGLLLLL